MSSVDYSITNTNVFVFSKNLSLNISPVAGSIAMSSRTSSKPYLVWSTLEYKLLPNMWYVELKATVHPKMIFFFSFLCHHILTVMFFFFQTWKSFSFVNSEGKVRACKTQSLTSKKGSQIGLEQHVVSKLYLIQLSFFGVSYPFNNWFSN